ncbi:F0F1 ATP synthase subunit B' [Rhodobacteraceae bacterium KMM 6894]|nr:F0F1 ATP synthase subunit B' [Rhodobacteraceae bacterium KMM 6894]
MATETTADAGYVSNLALEEAGVCVDSHGGAIGLPQLCGEWMGNQVFWLVVTLVIIFFVLSRIALPRIGAVLAERQGSITNDIAAAEDLKSKAVSAEEAFKKAEADARTAAQAIISEAKAEIKADLDVAMAKADAEIAAKAAEGEKTISEIRKNALANVTEVAKSATKDIVAAMGGTADAKTVNAAVTARMKG